MSMTGALPIWLTIIQEEEEDLTNLIKVPISNDGGGEIFLKTNDLPVIKSFSFVLGGTGTVTRTLEWANTYTGESVADIKAGASRKLLVVIKAKNNNNLAPAILQDVYASNTADTADGTKIIDTTWGVTFSLYTNPPIPIILDVNQFLTVVMNSPGDTIHFVGFTVELPETFTLT